MTVPGPGTRVFALLGDPVDHSLSPAIQNAAFRAAGLDALYVTLRCGVEDAVALVGALARAGGGGNVTVPHKARVVAALEAETPAVRRTGACNTFWLQEGRVHGDNTDVDAFTASATKLIGDLAGTRVLLLGAGGAASAALCALVDARCGSVSVLNRTRARAVAMRERYAAASTRVRVVADAAALDGEDFDLVVNATSLGLAATDPLPFETERLGTAGAVLDLVYGPGGTRWVRESRRAGLRAADGSAMLLTQAAAAFRRWTGREPDLNVMRAALERPLPDPRSSGSEPTTGGDAWA